MKKTALHIVTIAFTALGLLSPSTGAATPLGTAFYYQGQLTLTSGPGGSSTNGSIHMRFRLFDGPDQATASLLADPIYRCDVTVNKGLFSVSLDFGAVFNGEKIYLETATPDGNGGSCPDFIDWIALSPLQEILAVPYALHALSSPTGGGGSLSIQPCDAGEAINAVASDGTVTCLAVSSGDITAVQVQPGSGLVGGGTGGDVLLGTDPNVLQHKITGTCSNGIQSVGSDGSVTCATAAGPQMPELVSDTGWLPFPKRTEVNIDFGTADFDFIFGMMRSSDATIGNFLSPALGSADENVMPAYIALNGNATTSMTWDIAAPGKNLGSVNDIDIRGGDIRLIAVKRTPDFDSGWFSCATDVTYDLTHNIGSIPTFAMVEIAENADGSGWRVPTMSSVHSDGLTWRQTALVALTATTVTLRTEGSLAEYRSSGTINRPSAGYCRVQLFDWTPDYDSGWIAYSNAEGDRDKYIHHDLGQEPSLVMLWISESTDGSGWTLPAMSPMIHFRNRGTRIYSVNDRWAVVQGGSDDIAQFIDRNNVNQRPNSGYMRFLAWR